MHFGLGVRASGWMLIVSCLTRAHNSLLPYNFLYDACQTISCMTRARQTTRGHSTPIMLHVSRFQGRSLQSRPSILTSPTAGLLLGGCLLKCRESLAVSDTGSVTPSEQSQKQLEHQCYRKMHTDRQSGRVHHKGHPGRQAHHTGHNQHLCTRQASRGGVHPAWKLQCDWAVVK